MDEPFGAVDPVVRGRLQEEFLRLQRELGKTVLMVTHDIDEAVKMGDRVAVFASGGRLAQYDEPAAVLGDPADDFVAEFVGGSRGLRRLSVTRIDPDHLETMEGVTASELGGTIEVSATLEDAMALMMREDKPMVGVTQGARFLGVLTPNGVHEMLRASVRGD
jgi:osmoprotectant transport system ATP-binding protein